MQYFITLLYQFRLNLQLFLKLGNYTDAILPTNEVLSEIMSKGHVMHLQFSLDNFVTSSQNESQYVTKILSGRLRLFQIEFDISGINISTLLPQVLT